MPVKTANRITLFLLAALSLAAPGAAAEPVTIVALGDSLTAGFGVAPGAAFPEQLQAALRARGHEVTVVNAGVSGDTSTGGLARLDWSVPEEADGVIVELGANDALRGIDPAITREAITGIVETLQGRGQAVLLAGMRAPRNLGEDYAAAFDAIYDDLGADGSIVYYPFFLDGVATRADLNQPDGLHPTGEGIAEIVRRILPSVEELLARIEAAG